MLRACSALAVAWSAAVVACSTAPSAPATTPTSDAAHVRPSDEWHERMKDVGRNTKTMKRMLLDGEATDLRVVAEAANAAAEAMRLGYGRLEDRSVPGFATMARDAESWLLQVALEARQAHGDIARELFAAGKPHCVRCHEAHERAHPAPRSDG